MSQYMESGSYINPYYGTSAGQTPCATSGSDSPTATATALAAYYGNAGFAPTGTASGATAQAYASYYNNYMAAAGYFPGQHSAYPYGTAGTQRYPAEECKREGPEPVYHLRNVPVPPHITESGPNSLDDVLKPASKFFSGKIQNWREIQTFLMSSSEFLKRSTMTWNNFQIFHRLIKDRLKLFF